MSCRLAPPCCRADWDEYHRIRQEVLLESLKYAMEHPDEEGEPGHHPLLFWKDDQPIGTIRIDELDGGAAALRQNNALPTTDQDSFRPIPGHRVQCRAKLLDRCCLEELQFEAHGVSFRFSLLALILGHETKHCDAA